MRKSKTLKKQKFCFEDMPELGKSKSTKIRKHSPVTSFKDRASVSIALLQCLENGDPEGFVEILDAYLNVNRTQLAKKTHLARSTVQQAFSKHGNPTLKTLARIVHEAIV